MAGREPRQSEIPRLIVKPNATPALAVIPALIGAAAVSIFSFVNGGGKAPQPDPVKIDRVVGGVDQVLSDYRKRITDLEMEVKMLRSSCESARKSDLPSIPTGE